MSYRLKVKEPLAEGIRRIALEQIEIAENELRGAEDANAAVHNARRAMKRLRALLRLVRPGLDDAIYRRESQRFAQIGRMLAGQRDLHVMRQTLKTLAGDAPALVNGLVPPFESLLSDDAPPHGEPGNVRDKAAARLATARKAFAGNALESLEREHLFAGLAKVYRKARRLHRHCHTQGATDEDFHGLRKSVQQHWRHMQLLSRAWPEALSARAAEAKALSQLLGDDHDLAVLIAFAEAHADALSPDGVEGLRSAVRQAQSALREREQLHGARLFAERADDLVERLRSYWDAAQGLTDLTADAKPANSAADPARPVRKARVRRVRPEAQAKAAKPRAGAVAKQRP